MKNFKEKLCLILFESICIKENGRCDRKQENKLFVDVENIHNFFLSEIQELKKEIEGMKLNSRTPFSDDFCRGSNSTIEDILEIIKEYENNNDNSPDN